MSERSLRSLLLAVGTALLIGVIGSLRADLSATCDFAVDPFRSISGRIIGPDGEPVVGLGVEAQGRDRHAHTEGLGGSRPGGRFLVTDLDPAHEFRIRTDGRDGPGEAALLPAWSEWLRPGAHDVVIHVNAGVFLQGRLYDTGGVAPPRSGLVRARQIVSSGQPYSASGWVHADGSFRVGPVPPGAYALIGHAQQPDRGPSEPARASAPADGITLVLTVRPSRRGRIVGSENVGGFVLTWIPQGADAPRGRNFDVGQRGQFEIGPLTEDETARAYVWKPDDMRYALVRDVTHSEDPLEVRIRYGRWIEGRVALPRTSVESGPRGSVVTRSIEHGFERVDRVDGEGTFTIGGLPPGEYDLRYRPDVHGRAALGPAVRVKSGAPTKDVVLLPAAR